MRDSNQADDFIKDWERIERSGKHDMHRLKKAMLLLIANEAPLPPEWKDHKLNGKFEEYRECYLTYSPYLKAGDSSINNSARLL